MENLFDWPIAAQREGLGAMDNLEYLSGPTISQLRRQIELAALIASMNSFHEKVPSTGSR
ncbi:hypothetical protein [Mycoplana rhizolycopersici]|uniref:Uncharacterized protein n=1 Tax=Mycoplana rhizolycopersici TaxID=2746702 RepID=A0ABX2QHX9_9HYPH|nr:hypothetical protein [Rhizobium rhizolycopersici]NVP56208.1 hypothetical protein [Rhizobium rhizolycopersici]